MYHKTDTLVSVIWYLKCEYVAFEMWRWCELTIHRKLHVHVHVHVVTVLVMQFAVDYI